MIQSGGQLVLAETTPSFGGVLYVSPSAGLNLVNQFSSYAAIYRSQLWVYVVTRKLALGTARLPLKVYERQTQGRTERPDSAYARLLRQPNPRMNGKALWEWTVSTREVYGEAIWLKVRGRDQLPGQLWPLHPANVSVEKDGNGNVTYVMYAMGSEPKFVIPERDVVHFKDYNPDSTLRGMSSLEPLRMTLQNEDAARRATQAFWQNGARPSTVLKTGAKLSDGVAKRISADWNAVHGGVDNFAKTVVLEEGLEPFTLSLTAEEAQYIESRKLNREEVCAAKDIPPPVVHILDHATFSNITEQMRSMYRDTMAPRLQMYEADLDQQLRPEFGGEEIYAEFLMDEVLRGDFETRVTAYQQGINSGWLMPSEVREMENRPFVEGSDRLFVNSTMVPLEAAAAKADTPEAPQLVPPPPVALPPIPKALDVVMGRLGRATDLSEIDAKALTEGLNGEAAMVIAQLEAARHAGQSVSELRDRLRRVLWVKE